MDVRTSETEVPSSPGPPPKGRGQPHLFQCCILYGSVFHLLLVANGLPRAYKREKKKEKKARETLDKSNVSYCN